MADLSGKLSLCWGSMEGVPLKPFIETAATAGFEAITLNSVLFEDALRDGWREADIKQLLLDNGLRVSGIDPLFNWLPSSVQLAGDDVMSRITQAGVDDIIRIAHTVGADLVNAPLGLASPDSEQEVVDSFGALCDRLATEGLRTSLEFMPFTAVADLPTALRIVMQANRNNGGIMLDCWHLHRSGGTPDDVLAVPGEKLMGLQLDDAMPQAMGDVVEETLNYRLLPGEGCIDLQRLLGNLKTIGARVAIDVEVFKDSLRQLEPTERAAALYAPSQQALDSI
ncbi:MAG: sugar phosphate isomerase/epimerase family protein [Halioglobus sp.]